jgi:hypothetical protein
MDKRPADWEKLQDKYDPERKYRVTFMRFLNDEASS